MATIPRRNALTCPNFFVLILLCVDYFSTVYHIFEKMKAKKPREGLCCIKTLGRKGVEYVETTPFRIG